MDGSIIVTENIKEFMLYPLLFENEQDKLYDLITQKYIKLDPAVYQKINNVDGKYRELKQQLFRLYEM
ncbi:hypothetical protein J9303_12325 [Bacillaceae bacterium Marseille-Q3522]|nr:hypothetical protein [Bacillaceae bacterium Marseille-Q3522]